MNARRIQGHGIPLWPLLVLSACQAPRSSQSRVATSLPPSLPKAAASAEPQSASSAAMLVASARRPADAYAFVVGPCQGKPLALQCSFSVQLLAQGKVVATLALDPIWSDHIESLAPSRDWGMGDPLGQPRAWKAWRLGRGDDAVLVGATPIRLGPRDEGLVVRRVYRGDAHQMLVARRESGLLGLEINGRWSSVSVEPEGKDRDRLVLLARWPGEPGFLWAREAVWDDGAETLVHDSLRDPGAYLVGTGPYGSQEEAVAAAGSTCLAGSVVAPTDPYADLTPGGWMSAVVTGERPLGQKVLDAIKHCTPAAPAFMVPVRFRWVPRARHELPDGRRVEIGLEAFDGKVWPLTLRLVDSDRVVARLSLDWPVSVPIMAPATDVDLPAGDPLRPWRGASGWTLGDPQTAVVAAIRQLRLHDGPPAFLLSAESGFEHRQRRHTIVAVDDDHWRTVWQDADREGPAWSTVDVRPGSDGTDEILYFSFYEDNTQGSVDRAAVTRLLWEAGKKELSAATLGCPHGLSIVVLRTFVKVEQALAAKEQPCTLLDGGASPERPHPLVLPAPHGSGLRGYVLAYLSTDKRAVRQILSEAARCRLYAQATVRPWCNR